MANRLRERIRDCLADVDKYGLTPSHIVTAVQLPTGAVEVTVNTDHTVEKLQYILEAYDMNMHLKTNPAVCMLNIMVVADG